MSILIIASHPDDEVLGVGGTILKLSQKKEKIKVVFMATGITSRRNSNYKNSTHYEANQHDSKTMSKEINDLRKDAKKACKILQVNDVEFFDFPDNEMDTVPFLKIVKTIENQISKLKPTKIFTHFYNDLNIDHRITFQAVLTACRPIKNPVKELICFEVPSSTEWNYPSNFNPNYFVNINSQLPKKIKAMEAYKNEIHSFPHPRSSENLKIVASRWGSVSGLKHAEAFQIIRKIEDK